MMDKIILSMPMPDPIPCLYDVAATFKFFQMSGKNALEVRKKLEDDGWYIHDVIPAIEEV